MKWFGFCQLASSLPCRVHSANRREPPSVSHQAAGLLVHDDAAEVVRDRELLLYIQRSGVHAVDDGAAVGPVLGNGNPDVGAVEVDAARVVHVALAENDVLLEVPALSMTNKCPIPLPGVRS